MHNPYYRYHLAQQAFFIRDYDTAIEHLKYAAGKREKEDRFYLLMGLAYLQKGDEPTARKWLEKAEALAGDPAQQKRYRGKLEILLQAQK